MESRGGEGQFRNRKKLPPEVAELRRERSGRQTDRKRLESEVRRRITKDRPERLHDYYSRKESAFTSPKSGKRDPSLAVLEGAWSTNYLRRQEDLRVGPRKANMRANEPKEAKGIKA